MKINNDIKFSAPPEVDRYLYVNHVYQRKVGMFQVSGPSRGR